MYNYIVKPKIIVILLIITIISFNSFASNSNEIILKRINTYPKDENNDYYFRSLNDLEIYNDALFAIESFGNKILMFNINNNSIKYIKSIGRYGQGPKDLMRPHRISIWDGEMLILDSKGFSFFKLDGTFLYTFKRFGGLWDYVYVNELIFRKNGNPDKLHLIDVFTKKGKNIAKFGVKYINVDKSKFYGANPFTIASILFRGNILTDGYHIYCMNARFGDLIKFSFKGERLAKKNFVELFGKRGKLIYERNKKNYIEKGINAVKAEGRFPSDFIFRDSYLCNDKIYLIGDNYFPGKKPNDYIEIRAIDVKTLKPIKNYKFTITPSTEIISFAVSEKLSSPIFFISMETEQDYIIGIYTPTK